MVAQGRITPAMDGTNNKKETTYGKGRDTGARCATRTLRPHWTGTVRPLARRLSHGPLHAREHHDLSGLAHAYRCRAGPALVLNGWRPKQDKPVPSPRKRSFLVKTAYSLVAQRPDY